jgi:hypothetical protein
LIVAGWLVTSGARNRKRLLGAGCQSLAVSRAGACPSDPPSTTPAPAKPPYFSDFLKIGFAAHQIATYFSVASRFGGL